MLTAVETQDAQKARSISARVEEVAKDVDQQRNANNQRLILACLMDCAALAQQWRAAFNYFETAIAERHREFDYRNLRDILLPAAMKTRGIYQDIEKFSLNQPAAVQTARDVQTNLMEMDRIIERLESWPTNDPTRRNAARAAIATEKSLTDEELAATFSP